MGRPLIDRLRALLPMLRRGLVSDGDAEELFALLRDATGAEGFVLGQELDYRSWAVAVGVPEQWKADHSRLRGEDPSIPLLLRSPPGCWWVSERDLTPAERHTELYARSRDAGFRDVALAKIYSPFRDDLFFSVMRFDRRFTVDDLALLELLYPHIAAALATRRALAVLTEGVAPGTASVVVSFPDGVVRADADARKAIERRTGPLGTIGWQKATRALAEAAWRFTHAVTHGRSQTLWPGLRIDFAAIPAGRGESARLVGFLIDEDDFAPPDRAPPLVEALLSPRQLAIARDFVAGMTVGAIAEARRISAETVRAHLRETRRRLGVRGRAGLGRALGG